MGIDATPPPCHCLEADGSVLAYRAASGRRFASIAKTLDIELALKLAIGRNFRKSVAVT